MFLACFLFLFGPGVTASFSRSSNTLAATIASREQERQRCTPDRKRLFGSNPSLVFTVWDRPGIPHRAAPPEE
jgi:hypothetical protein